MRWRATTVAGIVLLFSVHPLLGAEPYLSAFLPRKGKVTAGLGMTPFVAYDASGLFYDGFVWRSSVRPDVFASLGLGDGVEAGVRWDFTPGINGYMKIAVSRRSAHASCLSIAGNWHRFALPEATVTAWSVWAGYITGSEWWIGRSGSPLSIAAGAGFLAGSGSAAGEEAEARAFGYYLTLGFPVRVGSDHSLRIVPEVSHLGSTQPIVLGYENVFGVILVPIQSYSFYRFGIGVSYVSR